MPSPRPRRPSEAPPASFWDHAEFFMLGRSCQSARFRHADRQKPGRWSFFSSRQRKRTLYRRFRELAWVGGCVTAPVGWVSGQGTLVFWFNKNCASWGHGAVDVMGPVAPPGHARVRGGAGVYTNWWKWPLSVVLGHLCTLLRLARVMRESSGGAGVYTNRRKWPLGIVLGHLCTLLRLARAMRAAVETQECTQIGGNSLSAPFWGICVHCCDSRGPREWRRR